MNSNRHTRRFCLGRADDPAGLRPCRLATYRPARGKQVAGAPAGPSPSEILLEPPGDIARKSAGGLLWERFIRKKSQRELWREAVTKRFKPFCPPSPSGAYRIGRYPIGEQNLPRQRTPTGKPAQSSAAGHRAGGTQLQQARRARGEEKACRGSLLITAHSSARHGTALLPLKVRCCRLPPLSLPSTTRLLIPFPQGRQRK